MKMMASAARTGSGVGSSITTKKQHWLFIYGTLKRGFPNHHHLPSSLEFHGPVRTVEPYPLVVAPPMELPFLLDNNDIKTELSGKKNVHQVVGELYSTESDDDMEFLDEFEGVHNKFYERITVRVEPILQKVSDDNNNSTDKNSVTTTDAMCYVRGAGGPDWTLEWTAERMAEALDMVPEYTIEHAQAFVSREER